VLVVFVMFVIFGVGMLMMFMLVRRFMFCRHRHNVGQEV
jgi:hypothetical protein